MKIWIVLLALVGLLILMSVARERFEPTQSIKAPPYDDAEVMRIFGMVSKADQDLLVGKATQANPSITDAKKLKVLGGKLLSTVVAEFFTKVFKPATVPVKASDVDTFLDTSASGADSTVRPVLKRGLTTYFVDQGGVGSSVTSGYAASLAAVGQNAGYLMPNATTGTPSPTGPTPSGSPTTTTASLVGEGQSTGTLPPNVTTGPPPVMPPVMPTTAGPTAGGTTGGSSVTAAAPNAGGTGKGRNVFGPTFTSLGAPVPGGDSSDSSKTNQYPELLGGLGDATSVRGPGGIQSPSQNWLLSQSGALPSTASLGTDANAGYLPYSRTPGDQDLIPDPYRMSRNYSTASYSSKTDPVPFLTDFSAFSK